MSLANKLACDEEHSATNSKTLSEILLLIKKSVNNYNYSIIGYYLTFYENEARYPLIKPILIDNYDKLEKDMDL